MNDLHDKVMSAVNESDPDKAFTRSMIGKL